MVYYARFKKGPIDIQGDKRSGRPRDARSDANISPISGLRDIDRRWTCEELEDLTGIQSSSVHRILTEDLGLRKITARWMPHLLDTDQKAHRLSIAKHLMLRFRREGDKFLERIITLDEAWACSYEPNLKSQNAEWRSKGLCRVFPS